MGAHGWPGYAFTNRGKAGKPIIWRLAKSTGGQLWGCQGNVGTTSRGDVYVERSYQSLTFIRQTGGGGNTTGPGPTPCISSVYRIRRPRRGEPQLGWDGRAAFNTIWSAWGNTSDLPIVGPPLCGREAGRGKYRARGGGNVRARKFWVGVSTKFGPWGWASPAAAENILLGCIRTLGRPARGGLGPPRRGPGGRLGAAAPRCQGMGSDRITRFSGTAPFAPAKSLSCARGGPNQKRCGLCEKKRGGFKWGSTDQGERACSRNRRRHGQTPRSPPGGHPWPSQTESRFHPAGPARTQATGPFSDGQEFSKAGPGAPRNRIFCGIGWAVGGVWAGGGPRGDLLPGKAQSVFVFARQSGSSRSRGTRARKQHHQLGAAVGWCWGARAGSVCWLRRWPPLLVKGRGHELWGGGPIYRGGKPPKTETKASRTGGPAPRSPSNRLCPGGGD